MKTYSILPSAAFDEEPARETPQPSYTYLLDPDAGRITGTTDGLDAVRQAVFCILQTERYAWVIYSRNYGVELLDLFGSPRGLAISELKRRIAEALMQDDRIDRVDGWSFSFSSDAVSVSFTVYTAEGAFESSLEVNV